MLDTGKKTLAARMKQALKQSGLYQKDIAKECDVTDQAVSGWLKSGKVDKSNLVKFAAMTGVNMDWLLTGDGEYKAQRLPACNQIFEMSEKPYTKGGRVLDQLRTMMASGKLSDDDMALLGELARRMRREKK